MPSEVDLLNAALGRVGLARIASIDDVEVRAQWCKVFYPIVRQALLRNHPWNFATTRVELAEEEDTPAFEWARAFTLPVDLLKVQRFNGTWIAAPVDQPYYWMSVPGLYTIEGRQLLTNDSQALILYTKDVVDPMLMDSLFFNACSLLLAAEIATAVRHDPKMRADLLNEVNGLHLPSAQAVNEQEGSNVPWSVPDLLWGR